jgi:hypothetical protein
MTNKKVEGKIAPRLSKKHTNLNINEKRFLKAIVGGSTPQQAALSVYKPKNNKNASALASQVLKRERFQIALEKAGLNDAMLSKAFVEGLQATRPIIVGKSVKDYKDYGVRHSYLKTALVVKGYYRRTDDQEESDHDPLIVKNVNILNQSINVTKKDSP